MFLKHLWWDQAILLHMQQRVLLLKSPVIYIIHYLFMVDLALEKHIYCMPLAILFKRIIKKRLFCIKQQIGLFYNYMKTKLPYSLTKAGLLCRPLPLPLMAGFTQKPATSGTAIRPGIDQNGLVAALRKKPHTTSAK